MDRPENTADVVAVLRLGAPIDAAHFCRLVEARLLKHARFREKVVLSGLLRRPTWEADAAFLLGRHIVVHPHLGRGRSPLRALVGAVASEPLNPHHPLWRIHLVEHVGSGSAIVAKLHHCLGDGLALVRLLLSLADEDASVPGVKHLPAATPRDPLADVGRLQLATKLILSLLRMASLPPDPPHLKTELCGRRQTAWAAGIPLDELRGAAHARGLTINDLVVTLLAGALRKELGSDAPDLRAMVPVNLRGPGEVDEELGNRFGLILLDLPVSLPSFEERLCATRSAMEHLKAVPDAVASYVLLAALGLGPPQLERFVIDFFTRKASLVVTNVAGPTERLHIAGIPIEQILFWVPHPALLGLGVSILSYAGEVIIGVRADEAVLPDPARLVRRLRQELRTLRPQPQQRTRAMSTHQPTAPL